MSGRFDLTTKYLLDTYPQDVLGHLLGLFPAGPIQYLEAVGNLASLRYDQDEIQAWIRRMSMIETPLMQALQAKGEAKALLTSCVRDTECS